MSNVHDFVTNKEILSLKNGTNKSEKEDEISVTNVDRENVSLGLV